MSPLDLADIRAEIERAIAAGEMVRTSFTPKDRGRRTDAEVVSVEGDVVWSGPALVEDSAPKLPPAPVDWSASIRQYWRWAAMAGFPNGVPPGFREEERPR